MSSARIMIMLRTAHCTNLASTVHRFHTSPAIYLNQDWRAKKNLLTNPNADGPLVNLPDYSFKDNRPTPYGTKQWNRIKKHQEYTRTILKLASVVDYAVERHAKLMKEKEERKKQILDNKLKPKGQLSIDSN